eukprot:5760582-Prymnesium_polylepis.1
MMRSRTPRGCERSVTKAPERGAQLTRNRQSASAESQQRPMLVPQEKLFHAGAFPSRIETWTSSALQLATRPRKSEKAICTHDDKDLITHMHTLLCRCQWDTPRTLSGSCVLTSVEGRASGHRLCCRLSLSPLAPALLPGYSRAGAQELKPWKLTVFTPLTPSPPPAPKRNPAVVSTLPRGGAHELKPWKLTVFTPFTPSPPPAPKQNALRSSLETMAGMLLRVACV